MAQDRRLCQHVIVKAARGRRWGLTHAIWAASVLIVALAANESLAQSVAVSPPSAGTDPFVQVSVDLAAGAFDRVLPFDVPFFIAGRAPGGTLSLEVQYAVLPQSGDVSNLQWMPGEPDRWKPDRST